MPAPLDLVGRRFGKLLVLKRTGSGRGGTWLCRCDCGREEEFPARRLPYTQYAKKRKDVADACSTCMHTRTCAACGRQFVSRQYRACCSPECERAHLRARYLQDYYARLARDPDLNRKRAAAVRERAAVDADFAQRVRAWEERAAARKRERLATDPIYADHVRRLHRERYSQTAEIVQARRRARWAAMDPEQQQAHLERRRALNTAWAQRRREALRESPARYREYLDRYNDYCRGWHARRRAASALSALMDLGRVLQTKIERNDDGS